MLMVTAEFQMVISSNHTLGGYQLKIKINFEVKNHLFGKLERILNRILITLVRKLNEGKTYFSKDQLQEC